MGTSLITLADYKTYKNLSTPNHDAEINNLIPKVSDLIKNYCKRTFVDYVNTAKVEYYNGGVEAFVLKESPVISVTTVEYSSDYGNTYSNIPEFYSWVLDDDCIVSTSNDGFVKRLRGYKITYKAGYVNIPEDLKLAALDLISYYRQNDAAVHSTKAPGTNSVQIEYISTTTLPAHIRRILDLYRADYT